MRNALRPDNIPNELKVLNQWVACSYPDKIPRDAKITPTSGVTTTASSTNPETWSSFEIAQAAINEGKYDNIGFVLNNNKIVAIDIDDCLDDDGFYSSLAVELMGLCGSYVEKSVGGNGLHIFVKGVIPFDGANNGAGLEIYQARRYIIMTGNIYAKNNTLVENQPALDKIIDKYFPDRKQRAKSKDSKNSKVFYRPIWEKPVDGKIKLRPTYPPIPEGQRNNSLTSLAGQLYQSGYQVDYILAELIRCNNEACDPPLPENEVECIINSVCRYPLNSKVKKTKMEEQKSDSNNVPDYIFYSQNGAAKVDEVKFANYLKMSLDMVCIGDTLYKSNGAIEDNYILSMIQKLISPYIKTNLSNLSTAILRATKNELRIKPPQPNESQIHVKNGVITVTDSGISFSEQKVFTLNELDVNYDPNNTDCPVWSKFIEELLFPDDIRSLQEFLGYCLIPSLRGESMLFILGVKGGEGKSRVGFLIKSLWGNSCNFGKLHDLQENRFISTVLENKLIFLDDDLKGEKLKDANFIKTLVTTPYIKYENKGKDAREGEHYCRLIAFGNTALSTLYDKSDALPRRLLLLKTRPKPTDRVNDKYLINKILNEKTAILNWCLVGLQRLIANGFNFTISERCKLTLDSIQEESNNIPLFLKDTDYVMVTKDAKDKTRTRDLLHCYKQWCADNEYPHNSDDSFSKHLRDFSEYIGIEPCEVQKPKRGRGYRGIKLTNSTIGGGCK